MTGFNLLGLQLRHLNCSFFFPLIFFLLKSKLLALQLKLLFMKLDLKLHEVFGYNF